MIPSKRWRQLNVHDYCMCFTRECESWWIYHCYWLNTWMCKGNTSLAHNLCQYKKHPPSDVNIINIGINLKYQCYISGRDLSNNQLEGPIPAIFGNLSYTGKLWASCIDLFIIYVNARNNFNSCICMVFKEQLWLILYSSVQVFAR